MLGWIKQQMGRGLAYYLDQPSGKYEPFSIQPTRTLRKFLQPADVLLVEGNKRISTAIKYLTQSTWSHASMYVGDALGTPEDGSEPKTLIEADLQNGVIGSPLSIYETLNTRICRPIGLNAEDRRKVVTFMVSNIGLGYDLKNVIDLMRYLLPQPPVPIRWRRKMMELGSGSPTRAICSTLIAQAFQSVNYPVIPVTRGETIYAYERGEFTSREVLHSRHHSLFTPRDFDLSPYFQVVKPTIEGGFDHKKLVWVGDIPADYRPRRQQK